MESMQKPDLSKKREFTSTQDAIVAFFAENDVDKLNFDTPEEAKLHVDLINKKYGDIAFVAKDRKGFSVKFKDLHLGEGFDEYKLDDKERYGNGNSDLEKAA